MEKTIPGCCKGCMAFEKHGKECWVYWENKKECTQNTSKINGLVL